MAILKLPNVGDTHRAKLKSCTRVQSANPAYGPQARFEFENGDLLFLPNTSMNGKLGTADRQLDRLGTTIEFLNDEAQEEAVWLKFSRKANPNIPEKPYWDIERIGAAPSLGLPPALPPERVPAASTRVPVPSQVPYATNVATGTAVVVENASAPSLAELYRQCVQFVVADIVPIVIRVTGSITAEAVLASAATMYISATRHLPPNTSLFGAIGSSAGNPPPSDDDYPGDDFFHDSE